MGSQSDSWCFLNQIYEVRFLFWNNFSVFHWTLSFLLQSQTPFPCCRTSKRRFWGLLPSYRHKNVWHQREYRWYLWLLFHLLSKGPILSSPEGPSLKTICRAWVLSCRGSSFWFISEGGSTVSAGQKCIYSKNCFCLCTIWGGSRVHKCFWLTRIGLAIFVSKWGTRKDCPLSAVGNIFGGSRLARSKCGWFCGWTRVLNIVRVSLSKWGFWCLRVWRLSEEGWFLPLGRQSLKCFPIP